MALVTNTQRALTERALNSIGRAIFLGHGMRRRGAAAANPRPTRTCVRRSCWAWSRRQCLAVEDSVTGTAAAESAGCPVLVVPNDVEVPRSAAGDAT